MQLPFSSSAASSAKPNRKGMLGEHARQRMPPTHQHTNTPCSTPTQRDAKARGASSRATLAVRMDVREQSLRCWAQGQATLAQEGKRSSKDDPQKKNQKKTSLT